MRLSYLSKTEEDTAAFAEALAHLAQKGDVFALFGTLGMGKSVFARAFIKALCPVEDVPSPTFTLLQTYETDAFEIYHYDLYRLKSAEEIWELNMEEALEEAVCLIEWPEKMGAYLPQKAIKINITPQNDGRKFELIAQDKEKQRFLKLNLEPEA